MKTRYNIQIETAHNDTQDVIVRINRASSRYLDQQFVQVLITPAYNLYELIGQFNNDEGAYVDRFNQNEMHEQSASTPDDNNIPF